MTRSTKIADTTREERIQIVAEALAWGDDEDPESVYSVEKQRCLDAHYHLFELPAREGTRKGITYAVRE